jgi:hypothetical protein
MLNPANSGDRAAAHTGMGHPHAPELIMRWIEACAVPEAHRVRGESTIAGNPLTHRDRLVAVWIEQAAAQPRKVS